MCSRCDPPVLRSLCLVNFLKKKHTHATKTKSSRLPADCCCRRPEISQFSRQKERRETQKEREGKATASRGALCLKKTTGHSLQPASNPSKTTGLVRGSALWSRRRVSVFKHIPHLSPLFWEAGASGNSTRASGSCA